MIAPYEWGMMAGMVRAAQLDPVAFSGQYGDLSDRPTLTPAALGAATTAQGVKADSALQPAGGAVTVPGVVVGTAFQAVDPTKPALLWAMVDVDFALADAGTLADIFELRIGPTAASVNGQTGLSSVPTTGRQSVTGIALTVGLGVGSRTPLPGFLPVGWWALVRRVSGTRAVVANVTAQAFG